VPTAIRRYVHSLGLDAYIVGGAVRDELLGIPHADEDFLVLGVDHAGLRALLEPHGRVEDMEVHGQLVGVRLHPRDRNIRTLVPGGIELTPPRAERSTGPGHRDFAIVSDASIGIEEDLARRDFTINAMALRLADRRLVDPFGGLGDLGRRVLRTLSGTSFRDDPLRLVRALRFVSQLGFEPTGETVLQMRLEAGGLAHVSAERIGGGLAADGMGELSKLLLGSEPARALRLARDTGVLEHVLPEFSSVVGYGLSSPRQPLPLDEHIFVVVQSAADHNASLAVRLAALLHDLGKPHADESGEHHALLGASIASRALARLRYPTRLRRYACAIIAAHSFRLDEPIEGRVARRFLAEHGEALALDLVAHKHADLAAKQAPEAELNALATLRGALVEERESPYRLRDLAVNGDDLRELGIGEGPALGETLRRLLAEVVDDPARNQREWLLARARELV
jgi:tRNA nucleotidyltransferase/poly(A) polymerase